MKVLYPEPWHQKPEYWVISVLEFRPKSSYLWRCPRECLWRWIGSCLLLKSQQCPHAAPLPSPGPWPPLLASATPTADECIHQTWILLKAWETVLIITVEQQIESGPTSDKLRHLVTLPTEHKRLTVFFNYSLWEISTSALDQPFTVTNTPRGCCMLET